MTTTETTISLTHLRSHLRRGSAMWQGRTTDFRYEDDTHLTAWAWVERPDETELAGAQVQVRHEALTHGEWLTVTQ